MKPIWAIVECARAPLMSGFTSMMRVPWIMVAAPATIVSTRAASSVASGANRISRIPPAFTTPA